MPSTPGSAWSGDARHIRSLGLSSSDASLSAIHTGETSTLVMSIVSAIVSHAVGSGSPELKRLMHMWPAVTTVVVAPRKLSRRDR